MKKLLLLSSLLLAACAHDPVPQPMGPGGSIVGVTSTGLIFTTTGHDLWLSEGVPASYFISVGHGRWYISSINWHQGNAIRLRRASGLKTTGS